MSSSDYSGHAARPRPLPARRATPRRGTRQPTRIRIPTDSAQERRETSKLLSSATVTLTWPRTTRQDRHRGRQGNTAITGPAWQCGTDQTPAGPRPQTPPVAAEYRAPRRRGRHRRDCPSSRWKKKTAREHGHTSRPSPGPQPGPAGVICCPASTWPATRRRQHGGGSGAAPPLPVCRRHRLAEPGRAAAGHHDRVHGASGGARRPSRLSLPCCGTAADCLPGLAAPHLRTPAVVRRPGR